MRYWACLPCTVFLVAILGCPRSDGVTPPPSAKVSGSIKLDGKPMPGGEIRFSVSGFPPKTLQVTDGSFSGEVFSGKNQVEASYEKEGAPHPMDPKTKLKVNVISPKYSGPNSPLNKELTAGENPPLSFEVTSKK